MVSESCQIIRFLGCINTKRIGTPNILFYLEKLMNAKFLPKFTILMFKFKHETLVYFCSVVVLFSIFYFILAFEQFSSVFHDKVMSLKFSFCSYSPTSLCTNPEFFNTFPFFLGVQLLIKLVSFLLLKNYCALFLYSTVAAGYNPVLYAINTSGGFTWKF